MASFLQIANDAAEFKPRLADSIHDHLRVWIFYVGSVLPGYSSQHHR